jgi:hypothetical protein
MAARVHDLTLNVLGHGVRVNCLDRETSALLLAAYSSLQGHPDHVDLNYTVSRSGTPTAYYIERQGRARVSAPDDGSFLALFDEDVTVELQKLRSDLYVIHAGVVLYGAGAVMLVAGSGGGKSTLCWALLHHGFGYLSDELAPVDLDRLTVHPYRRALILKDEPPSSYRLTSVARRTARGFYVPASDMPGAVPTEPPLLTAIFFLVREVVVSAPSVRAISPAEGAARLYANALNSLAHPNDGLDGAIRIAAARPRFDLVTGDLTATCALVTTTLQRLS